MIGEAARYCTVELQALPPRIRQVRRIVCAHLRYWRLDPLIDAAALGVSELLANVHRHAEPDKRCTVELVHLRGHLTVSVGDGDPRVPELRTPGPSATCGRGLALVASVSESWGVRPRDGGGKTVWFTLPALVPAATAGPRLLRGDPGGGPPGRGPGERGEAVRAAVPAAGGGLLGTGAGGDLTSVSPG